MANLITPDEVPQWVPGETIATSRGLGWRGLALRGYRYAGQRVQVPALRDFMLVIYRHGATPMERRFDGRWTRAKCGPGRISLHTRAQASEWTWSTGVEVDHLYLENELLTRLASEALERPVLEVSLRDALDVEDPVLWTVANALRAETCQQGLGGSLYAEALGNQLALHLLRRYSSVSFQPVDDPHQLTAVQRRRLLDYLDANLGNALDLATLANHTGLGLWSFNRRFRATFGCAPYEFVMTRRLERAYELVVHGKLPLKQIAPACGFNDQAHLTRAFKARFQTTPGALRRPCQD